MLQRELGEVIKEKRAVQPVSFSLKDRGDSLKSFVKDNISSDRNLIGRYAPFEEVGELLDVLKVHD